MFKLFQRSKPEISKACQPKISLPPNRTCFHITHWKAGSQWIRGILDDAFGQQIVPPAEFEEQVLGRPIQAGCVYECAYVDEVIFRNLELPPDTKKVVIIRDLRDTLVSGYFSVRNTHEITNSLMAKWRSILSRLSVEDGLLYFAHIWAVSSAHIQRSWIEAGEPVIQLEQFMNDPAGTMKRLLRESWQLEVDGAAVDALMARHSFAKYSGGRKAGQEDASSHYRKGIAGDWRNHFTPKVSNRFKELYGDLLIKTGYEKDLNW